jgi:Lon protease-like protein
LQNRLVIVSHFTPEYLDVPVFPLPNVTFFPQTFLPLHVFEPRYRLMLANALAGDRLLGVALLKEGWQRDYFGAPPICKTFGVGKIIDHVEHADGRANIVLEGLYRVRLVQEHPTGQFRSARVQVLSDPPVDDRRDELTAHLRELESLSRRISALMPPLRETIQSAWSAHPHPLVVTNHLAAGLVVDAYDRQSILEQDDPMRRIRLLGVQMRAIAQQLDLNTFAREEVLGED